MLPCCAETSGDTLKYRYMHLFLFQMYFLIDRRCQKAYIAQVFRGNQKRKRKTTMAYRREKVVRYSMGLKNKN
jgi:hypothetical protein